ncbi:FAD-dependent oxidoreductase [Nakamurella sp. A5-74]|uniref:FAD-dependent oxidoreductase n=1 Tax=Nakamurella sp. A5-74 TaxID=3158264 RepID=A0AAU8DKE8_9ACTN
MSRLTADVIVVGAGIVGAACARSLAATGARVVVVDRGPAAGGTSSAGEGNLLVSDKGPGPELDLALHAAQAWTRTAAELVDELGPAFPAVEYEPKGGLVVTSSAAGGAALLAFAETQRSAGVQIVPVDGPGAREYEPQLSTEITTGVFYPQDAQVQPVNATEALLASARRRGATVLTHRAVTGALTSNGSIVGVLTEREQISAPVVLNCAGPWAGAVAASLGVQLPVRPRRGMVLVTTRMPHLIFHKVYDGDYVAATQSADTSLQTSSVVECTAGGTVLIGSSREQIGFDDRLRIAVLAELAAKALRLFPFLADASVMRAYGGYRPYMPDHLPAIGADPRLPGLFHATGHEGAGIGLSVSTADLITALVTGTTPPLDPTPFALTRTSLHAEQVA